jgi:hypothetical protein
VVAGMALMFHAVMQLRSGAPLGLIMLYILIGIVGTLLLLGLWTPLAGTALAVLALWKGLLYPAAPCTYILFGTLGVALALIGPGGWSVDAHLFGWKRVELPDRKS